MLGTPSLVLATTAVEIHTETLDSQNASKHSHSKVLGNPCGTRIENQSRTTRALATAPLHRDRGKSINRHTRVINGAPLTANRQHHGIHVKQRGYMPGPAHTHALAHWSEDVIKVSTPSFGSLGFNSTGPLGFRTQRDHHTQHKMRRVSRTQLSVKILAPRIVVPKFWKLSSPTRIFLVISLDLH